MYCELYASAISDAARINFDNEVVVVVCGFLFTDDDDRFHSISTKQTTTTPLNNIEEASIR
jgi:hypothetical protein